MSLLRPFTLSVILASLFVLSGLAAPPAAAQPDVSGDWEGQLTQLPGGTQSKFYFRISLRQSGGQLEGSSRIELIGQPQYYALMDVTGSIDGETLRFAEGRILEQVPEPGTRWCVKSAELRYTVANGVAALVGDWISPGCAPGSIRLDRSIPAEPAPPQQPTAQPGPPPQPSGPIAEIVRVDPSQANLGQPIFVDFQVNGANFPQCDQTFRAPVRVMLVFDTSGSMGNSNLMEPARNAANSFIDLLDPAQDEIGLLSFSDQLQIEQAPSRDYDAVRSKLGALTPGGGTNTSDAIAQARSALGTAGTADFVQPVILLLTDGLPDDPAGAISAARDASANGAIVLAINAGDLSGEPILQQMVQDPATDYFFAPTPQDLQGTFERAFQTFDRLALVGIDVVVSEQLVEGYAPVPGSLSPEDGQIVGNTIEWRLSSLARRDQPAFSYSVLPLVTGSPPFSAGQQVIYTDCNRSSQRIQAPVSDRSAVPVTDPAGLPFSATPRNQPYLGPEARPQPWLWAGIGLLVVLALSAGWWLLASRRKG